MTLVGIRLSTVKMDDASEDWFVVTAGDADRLSMQGFLDQLAARTQRGATVGDLARWLTVDYVIEQHERVANLKLPSTGDTYRFRREAGRLRFFDKPVALRMNDSRFHALSTVLFELDWTGHLPAAQHGLTPAGVQVREHGDMPAVGEDPVVTR
jgi:hypothetical protein